MVELPSNKKEGREGDMHSRHCVVNDAEMVGYREQTIPPHQDILLCCIEALCELQETNFGLVNLMPRGID